MTRHLVRGGFAAVLAVAVLAFAGRAQPAQEGVSFFLSSRTRFDDGHVPLAVVRAGEVVDAVPRARHAGRARRCGVRARWAAIGSRWQALDEWGQVVATGAVTRRRIYDDTQCAELELSPAGKKDDLTLYVSEDSAWRPSPSPAWTPSAAAQGSFEALARATIDDHQAGRRAEQRECSPISRRMAFFKSATGKHYGVVTSNVGYLVAILDGDAWSTVVAKTEPRRRPPYYTCYRPVSIFDMNADGIPEVVLFQSMGESWGDLVLGVGRDGTWRIVAISPGSAIV